MHEEPVLQLVVALRDRAWAGLARLGKLSSQPLAKHVRKF